MREHPVANDRVEALLGDHVDLAREQILDPLAELDEGEAAVTRDVLD